MKQRNILKEKALNSRPSFYKSLSKAPLISQLKTMGVRINLPIMSEIIKGYAGGATSKVYFINSYKKLPFVTGVLKRKVAGEWVTTVVTPDNEWLFVSKNALTIGEIGGNELSAGDYYALRVYNIIE